MSERNNGKNETSENVESISDLAKKSSNTNTSSSKQGATLLTIPCRCGNLLKNVEAVNGIAKCPKCGAENKC